MSLIWTKARNTGLLTDIDWSQWLDRRDVRIDPYLVWADLSGAAGFAAREDADLGADHTWPFILELKNAKLPVRAESAAADQVPLICGMVQIPGVYLEQDKERQVTRGKYVTAQVRPRDVKHLLLCGDVRRAQLGLPRIRDVSRDVPPLRAQALTARGVHRVVVGIIDDGFGFAHHRLLDAYGNTRVRYLWDQDVRRERLIHQCRVGHEDGLWVSPRYLGYGAEVTPDQFSELMWDRTANEIDPWRPYRRLGYGRWKLDPLAHSSAPTDGDNQALPIEAMLSASHGHSVTDLAAGYPPVRQGGVHVTAHDISAGPRDGRGLIKALDTDLQQRKLDVQTLERLSAEFDAADQTSLICVQLPVRTVADTSGGSLAVHVLDGLHYILDRAQMADVLVAEGPGELRKPVVINVSYGALGGGHDGTSILEQAMLELVRKPPGGGRDKQPVQIVLAAGNAHHSSTHASVQLAATAPAHLVWQVGPDNPLESFLEIWLPDVDPHEETRSTKDRFVVTLDVDAPGGQRLPAACLGQVGVLLSGSGDATSAPLAALVYARKVVQGTRGTMVLLAVAPTRRAAHGGVPGPHGEWIITLHRMDGGEIPIDVHAWTERNDLVFGAPRAQQSRVYADEPVGEASEADPEARAAWRESRRNPDQLRAPHGVRPQFGLSSLAGVSSDDVTRGELGRGIFVVGAHRINDDEATRSSSGGPGRLTTRRQEVDAVELGQLEDDETGDVQRRLGKAPRQRPDFSAAGDQSAAVPGVRTAGLHSAVEARISGTSAAAAQVTRALANLEFIKNALVYQRNLKDDSLEFRMLDAHWFETYRPGRLQRQYVGRATTTPQSDDGFRRARKRPR